MYVNVYTQSCFSIRSSYRLLSTFSSLLADEAFGYFACVVMMMTATAATAAAVAAALTAATFQRVGIAYAVHEYVSVCVRAHTEI